ncbi:MAG: SDR family NAD(P)-dependent oxidoreductase [Acidimicrobiales bacterium]
MSTLRFEGRRVVVTGATSGIGRATALAFAAEGALVTGIGRRSERLDELRADSDGVIEPVALDITERQALREAIDRIAAHGKLDVLVNNAGVAYAEPLLEVTDDHWDHTLEVNLTAAFVASQAAARHMVAVGQGTIVNIASVDAFVAESPFGAYCPSKAGLVMLTRMLAFELGPLGIRCNALCPGMVVTEMTADDLSPAFEAAYVERIPLGRFSEADEQARVVLFLASDDASYLNGAAVEVDGGERSGFWYPGHGPGTRRA